MGPLSSRLNDLWADFSHILCGDQFRLKLTVNRSFHGYSYEGLFLREFFISSLLIKTAIAGGVKASAAIIGFALTAVVARTLGAEQAGLFLFGFTLIIALSGFFRLGLDNVILRWMGSEGVSVDSQQNLNRGLLWIVVGVIPFSCIVVLSSNFIATSIFNKPDFSIVLFWMILALPSITLFTLLAMAFQGLHRTVIAILFQNLGLSSLFLACFSVAWWQGVLPLNAQSVAALYAICALVICGLAFYIWFRQANVCFKVDNFGDKDLWTASSNLWAASSMSLLVQWSGVLVAGAFVASEDLAFFSAAQRTAMLTSFVLVVVNMVVAPRYAKLWQQKNIKEIQRLAKLSTRGMIALVLPVIAVMMMFPEWIMGLFGEGFEQGAKLLIIMALGQFINVATGSVGYLLTMSGHEKDFRRVTFFAGPLTLILSYFLIMEYGVLGAAIATAIGLSLQNLLALAMVRKRLGFWPIG